MTENKTGPTFKDGFIVPLVRNSDVEEAIKSEELAYYENSGSLESRPRSVVNDCYTVAVRVASKIRGRGGTAEIYSLRPLQAFRGITFHNTFQHEITICEISGQSFLVDQTFSQFINDNGQVRDKDVISSTDTSHPLIRKLLKDGYVLLTDDVLNEYLDITCQRTTNEVKRITVEQLPAARLTRARFS